MKKKVFVAMSGGVDSSVAAGLLKKEGYEVIGAHMKCFNVDGCAAHDAEDARKAAEVLGIPFYVFDFEKEYKDKVVEYMVDGYRKGITPNPDVMCNKEIKFGLFLKKALELGADYVATGHYVRIKNKESRIENGGFKIGKKKEKNSSFTNRYSLFSARDSNKDQSYFLWTLTQNQLKYCLFPLGDITKPEVRKLAKKFKLPNAEKKDSQGICFLGQVDIKDFLKKYIPEKKGIILNTKGEIIGEHKGAHLYTIGQRSIGVGGAKKPLYIAEKDIKENALLVAEEDEEILTRKEVELVSVNLINPELGIKNKELRINVLARVRYRQPLFPALFTIHDSSFKLIFDKPVKFIASGQSAVFYECNPSLRHSTLRVSGVRPENSAPRDPMGSGCRSGELRMLGGGVIK